MAGPVLQIADESTPQVFATSSWGPLETAQVVAVIPARGGSKGVPRKNLRVLGGEPLIARAVRSIAATHSVDATIVSTDCPDIAAAARTAGALVVHRPAALAGDEASSESALEHVLSVLSDAGAQPEVTVFVQATSPFIDPGDLDRAIDTVLQQRADVAFSVVRSEQHLWRHGVDGPEGINHDHSVRLRRQDRIPEYTETGAFYVLQTRGFLRSGHRFFGEIAMIEVDPADAIEIDTEADFAFAEHLLAYRSSEPSTGPINARAVVTDFDGVHTDDTALIDSHGTEVVQVSRSDGMGVAQLRRAGVPTLILSTETNPVVQARADKLQIDAITGCDDKLTALTQWASDQDIALSDVAYLGNDVNDVECLRAVGWPAAPADAHPAARAAARILLRRRGGDGVVRELADRVLAHHETEGVRR